MKTHCECGLDNKLTINNRKDARNMGFINIYFFLLREEGPLNEYLYQLGHSSTKWTYVKMIAQYTAQGLFLWAVSLWPKKQKDSFARKKSKLKELRWKTFFQKKIQQIRNNRHHLNPQLWKLVGDRDTLVWDQAEIHLFEIAILEVISWANGALPMW